MTDVSVSLPARRKRGRPHKDDNLCRDGSLQSPKNPNPMKTQPREVNNNSKDTSTIDGLVGSMVYGVIEGSFDAGYLISVRIGNNDKPFRGVVFQPRKLVPITSANDVAPQAKMYKRREIPVPVYDDDLTQINTGFSSPHPVHASKQAVFRPVSPSIPPSLTPYHSAFVGPDPFMLRPTTSCSNMRANITTGSLKMVEEDEVMQVFEVSTSSKGSKNNMSTAGEMISESSFKATTTSILPGKECINQKTQFLGNAMDSNVELRHNFTEDMPRSVFEIHGDEMASHVLHPTDLYYNELRSSSDVNFHQNLFANQSQPDSQHHTCLATQFHSGVSSSPNLNLDLASADHQKKPIQPQPQATDSCDLETNYLILINNETKSPNLGYHQALVSGNPLLLPPDIIGEPLEFMLGKPKSPPNSKISQETNLEVESSRVGERSNGDAEAAGSLSGTYKLELATPQPSTLLGKQTNSSAGRITDMDFDLSDVVQPVESHGHHQSVVSESKDS